MKKKRSIHTVIHKIIDIPVLLHKGENLETEKKKLKYAKGRKSKIGNTNNWRLEKCNGFIS